MQVEHSKEFSTNHLTPNMQQLHPQQHIKNHGFFSDICALQNVLCLMCPPRFFPGPAPSQSNGRCCLRRDLLATFCRVGFPIPFQRRWCPWWCFQLRNYSKSPFYLLIHGSLLNVRFFYWHGKGSKYANLAMFSTGLDIAKKKVWNLHFETTSLISLGSSGVKYAIFQIQPSESNHMTFTTIK